MLFGNLYQYHEVLLFFLSVPCNNLPSLGVARPLREWMVWEHIH